MVTGSQSSTKKEKRNTKKMLDLRARLAIVSGEPMNTETNTPKCKINGLTFFPVPVFDDASLAFGASEADFFDRNKRPEVPRAFLNMASSLFFNGGKLPDLSPKVDRQLAQRAVRAWLSSFAPAHESKESTVGYALWLWTTDAALPENEEGRP